MRRLIAKIVLNALYLKGPHLRAPYGGVSLSKQHVDSSKRARGPLPDTISSLFRFEINFEIGSRNYCIYLSKGGVKHSGVHRTGGLEVALDQSYSADLKGAEVFLLPGPKLAHQVLKLQGLVAPGLDPPYGQMR